MVGLVGIAVAAAVLASVPAPASAWRDHAPPDRPTALVVVRRRDTGAYHLAEIGEMGTALRHSVAIPIEAVTDPDTGMVNWWGVHCQPLYPRGKPWHPSWFEVIHTFGAGVV